MLIKIIFSKGKKIMRRMGLCYVFTNSFNVRFNKIQLESHICFCILSDVMLYSLYGKKKIKIILWFIVTISSLLLLELAVHVFQVYLNHCACHSQKTGVRKTARFCWKSLRAQPGSPSPLVLFSTPQSFPDLQGACEDAQGPEQHREKAGGLYQWSFILILPTCVPL